MRNSRDLFSKYWSTMEREWFNFFRASKKMFTHMPMLQYDIQEKADKILITFELPNIKEEQVELSIRGNYLTISVENREEVEVKNSKTNFYRHSKSYGKVQQTVSLPSRVDPHRFNKRFDHGLLKVELIKI